MKSFCFSFALLFLISTCSAQKPKTASSFKDSNGKYGLKDASGKVIVQGTYTYQFNFSNGLARVINNKKTGLIDTTGKIIAPLQYDVIFTESEGFFKVKKEGGKHFFINRSGKEIHFAFDYDDVDHLKNGRIIFTKNYKNGVIDSTGKIIVAAVYDKIKSYSEGLAAFSKGGSITPSRYYKGKWGFIDLTGKEVIPMLYDVVSSKGFNDGMCAVSNDDEFMVGMNTAKWGYINTKGSLSIPFLFNGADPFSKGVALVNIGMDETGEGGHWGFIKKDGKPLFPFIKCFAMYGSGLEFENDGFAHVKGSREYFHPDYQYKINKKGERIK